MRCPNPDCGAENADTNRFCILCGRPLIGEGPTVKPPRPSGPPKTQAPLSQIALYTGIIGIVGGGLIILGWLLPWFGLGDIADSILDFTSGYRFGLPSLTRGVGSGLQMSLYILIGSFAIFTSEEYGAFGLLGLAIVAVLVVIPIAGAQVLRAGIDAFQFRILPIRTPISSELDQFLSSIKNGSKTVLVIMIIFFILFSVIPFLTAALGSGFYLTILGSVGSYLGAYFTQIKLRFLQSETQEPNI